MGGMLPKPVMTAVNETYGSPIFKVGSSCLNGYRDSMEDAHLIFMKPDWGFFGVFDGHVNGECSQYVADEFEALLPSLTIPLTDERLREIALQIDKKFIDAKRTGGSTGTFFIAQKLGADNIHMQVGNVGDSRVLAWKDGQCVSLTNDHKPTLPGEKRRIEACGGFVENARVNGSLAVSRAFGDGDYKNNTLGDQLSQPVIALAEVSHCDLKADSKDFALLACDGVFEGNFSNEEVMAFAAEQLALTNDSTVTAQRVCEEAIARGSKDNISCVIVQFMSRPDFAGPAKTKVYVPGPFSSPSHQGFRKAYFAMAEIMNLTPAQCLELRYDAAQAGAGEKMSEAELNFFKDGPPGDITDSNERTKWFGGLLSSPSPGPNAGMGGAGRDQPDNVMRMQQLQSMGIPMNVILELLAEVNSSRRP